MDSLKKPLLNPNKHLKEQFVSNLTGSSMLEIAALSTFVPALIVLRQWSRFCQVNEVKLKKDDNVATCQKFWKNYVVSLAVDFLFIFLPILSVFTVLADWVYICAICLTLLLLFCLLAKRFRSSSFHSKGAEGELSSLRTNILSYRVSMMVVTCVCILAVDFKIFPRRYAKTETYGTGLMDLGVGSFVVANSLVSRQTRDAISTRKWKAVLQSTSPLLLLGTGRLISTTGIDYQVHVGEYGVHWNFFFTLAAVSILTTTINIHPQFCGIFGSVVLIGYQICLKCGLNEYLLSKERALNFISSNKEGLFSIFGYWGMYLVGVHLGYHLFFGSQSGTKMRSVQWAKIRVWFLAILFWSLAIVLDKGVEKVSRRMCNLAYVSLVFAQNFQVLSILMFSDFIPGKRPLVLEEVFNQNLLGSFLLANLLTGMVNLNMDTLSASSPASFSILLGYSVVLTALVGFAGLCGVKLKFW